MGKEASGTGNMKFALNGAVTIGTLDGANVKIRDHVGNDNIHIFGMTADQVQAARDGYVTQNYIDQSPILREVIDQIRTGHYSPDEPIIVVCNMTPAPRAGYRLGVPNAGDWGVALNSNAGEFGGSGVGPATCEAEAVEWSGKAQPICFDLPGNTALFFRLRDQAAS